MDIWLWRLVVVLIGATLVFLLLYVALVGAAHTAETAWMDRDTHHQGTRCCGEQDCRRAGVALVARDEERAVVIVLVDGVLLVLPSGAVHHSEDGEGWWCATDVTQPPAEASCSTARQTKDMER